MTIFTFKIHTNRKEVKAMNRFINDYLLPLIGTLLFFIIPGLLNTLTEMYLIEH